MLKRNKWLCLIVVLVLLLTLSSSAIFALDPPSSIELLVTYRDFHGIGWGTPGTDTYYEHPDFERNPYSSDLGIIKEILGPDSKPVYEGVEADPTITSEASFNMWFNDTEKYNRSMLGTLIFNYDPVTKTYLFNDTDFFPLDFHLL